MSCARVLGAGVNLLNLFTLLALAVALQSPVFDYKLVRGPACLS